jgi:hypothetical protein
MTGIITAFVALEILLFGFAVLTGIDGALMIWSLGTLERYPKLLFFSQRLLRKLSSLSTSQRRLTGVGYLMMALVMASATGIAFYSTVKLSLMFHS